MFGKKSGHPKQREYGTMKRNLALLVCVFAMFAAAGRDARAETIYLTDTIRITLRTGPGIDHKIVAMIDTGKAAELLERGEQWSQVRLADGKEGWVLNRFLSDQEPSQLTLARLQNKYQELMERASPTLKELAQMKEANQSLADQLAEKEQRLVTLNQSYEALKKDSSDFLAVKAQYEKAKAALDQQSRKVNELESEVGRLAMNRTIRWFLSGAGVLLLGFIIGYSAKRKQRRSSSLL